MTKPGEKERFILDLLIIFLAGLAIGFVLLLTAGVTSAGGAPCPRTPAGKCGKVSIAYDYLQTGRDAAGHLYVRTCHVPIHGKRHCTAWRRVRTAFPMHHPTRASLR